ncbi:MAG: hypothetical protein GY778_18760, partial [bacterium]|nr:hypothetical protein [bacterium]
MASAGAARVGYRPDHLTLYLPSPVPLAIRYRATPVFENIFETVNSGLAQAMYEDFLRDPESVPVEWRVLFENGLKGEAPAEAVAGPAAAPNGEAAPVGPSV